MCVCAWDTLCIAVRHESEREGERTACMCPTTTTHAHAHTRAHARTHAHTQTHRRRSETPDGCAGAPRCTGVFWGPSNGEMWSREQVWSREHAYATCGHVCRWCYASMGRKGLGPNGETLNLKPNGASPLALDASPQVLVVTLHPKVEP